MAVSLLGIFWFSYGGVVYEKSICGLSESVCEVERNCVAVVTDLTKILSMWVDYIQGKDLRANYDKVVEL